MTLTSFDTVMRTRDFEARAAELSLRPWQWDVIVAVDGRMRLGELARTCSIDLQSAIDVLTQAHALGLVELVVLPLDHYRATSLRTASKTVTVSFDSMSSMLAQWDGEGAGTPVGAPAAAVAPSRVGFAMQADAFGTSARRADAPDDAPANGDVRGTVLRVLGLKR
ncbi:MAG: hypothetical protein NVS2B3_00650 [Vulcanimicrobiaceae bacterium]